MIDKELLERNMRTFMYAHPARRKGRASFLKAMAAMAVIAVVAAIPLSSSFIDRQDLGARASIGPSTDPKTVIGYVYELAGGFASGVTVVVKMINNGTLVDTQTAPFPTGSDGFYSVTFDKNKWGYSWTIRVEATRSAETGINETSCDAEFQQYVNATLGVNIPEFGSYAPIVGGVLFIGVITATSARRRRKSS